ncbi:MAG: zinc ribbon domain-containing protein [Clostridia bacterium]
MDFMKKINEISKRVGDGVADTYKTVADKSGKLFEEVKVKTNISDKENEIQEIYINMGKTVYDMYKSGEDVGKVFTKECKNIDKSYNEIEDMNKKVLYNKNLRKCSNCFEIIDLDSVYCENCGEKQKSFKIKEDKKEEKVDGKEEKVERVCPTCGYISEQNAKFCLKCGYKF